MSEWNIEKVAVEVCRAWQTLNVCELAAVQICVAEELGPIGSMQAQARLSARVRIRYQRPRYESQGELNIGWVIWAVVWLCSEATPDELAYLDAYCFDVALETRIAGKREAVARLCMEGEQAWQWGQVVGAREAFKVLMRQEQDKRLAKAGVRVRFMN